MGVIFLVCFGYLGYYAYNHLVLVDKLGDIEVFGLSRDELNKKASEYVAQGYLNIVLPDQTHRVSFSDVGLEVDLGEYWYGRFTGESTVAVRMTKRNMLVKSKTGGGNEVVFDDKKGSFVVKGLARDYAVDLTSSLSEIASQFGKKEIYVVPKYELRNWVIADVEVANRMLRQIYSTPLVVKIKEGLGFVDLVVSEQELVKWLDVNESVWKEKRAPMVNRGILESVKVGLSKSQKEYFDEEVTYKNIVAEVENRFKKNEKGAVLGIDDGPTTRGELAERYLEVDISQQKMYLFDKGKVWKEYHVSTGEYYATPVGRYNVFSKAPKAFSDIYGVWMPYWMGFKYAEDIGAYLGLHELPYVAGADGSRLYRYGYYIGNKKTGGCVAMEPKDSKEVYDMTPIGTIVNVVE